MSNSCEKEVKRVWEAIIFPLTSLALNGCFSGKHFIVEMKHLFVHSGSESVGEADHLVTSPKCRRY